MMISFVNSAESILLGRYLISVQGGIPSCACAVYRLLSSSSKYIIADSQLTGVSEPVPYATPLGQGHATTGLSLSDSHLLKLSLHRRYSTSAGARHRRGKQDSQVGSPTAKSDGSASKGTGEGTKSNTRWRSTPDEGSQRRDEWVRVAVDGRRLRSPAGVEQSGGGLQRQNEAGAKQSRNNVFSSVKSTLQRRNEQSRQHPSRSADRQPTNGLMDQPAGQAISALRDIRDGSKLRQLAARSHASPSFHLNPNRLPEIIHLFHTACSRLRFKTQLPAAIATYMVNVSRRGAPDIASYDVTVLKELVQLLGSSQVVNRECMDVLRRALQGRWPELQPTDLVELIVGLRLLNDADRFASVGRSGQVSSPLLRMLLDAEPCVNALLNPEVAAAGGEAAAADGQAAAGGPAAAGKQGRGGERSKVLGEGGARELPRGAVMQLALAYLSFYATAASGRNFAMAPLLMSTLEACLARLDLGNAAESRARDLVRLVSGLADVVKLPTHPLVQHLRRCAKVVVERLPELSQQERTLLAGVPQQHKALPPDWRQVLLESNVS